MYNIIYDYNVELKIQEFVDWYKQKNLNNFTDTGLFYENLIRENYIQNAKVFKKDIFDSIEKNLQKTKIIVYKPLENKNLQIIIIVGNYRLFVEYSEDNNEKVRFVEDIIFNRK